MKILIKSIIKQIYFLLRMVLFAVIPSFKKTAINLRKKPEILLIRMERIGDMVYTTPIFKVLKMNFPDSKLTVLTTAYSYDLIRNDPNIDDIIIYKNFFKTIFDLRNKFDLVFDLLLDYNLKPAFITYLLKPQFSIGYDIMSRGKLFTNPVKCLPEKKHFIDYLFDLLEPLKIQHTKEDKKPMLYYDPKTKSEVDLWLNKNKITDSDKLITIHPGGFYPSQRWPMQYYTQLITSLISSFPNLKIVILGSKNELPLFADIYKNLERTLTDKILTYQGNITHVLYLIKTSKLFIGNNSGLIHIAAALETPNISFMGPTVYWLWWPYGQSNRNIVFRKDLSCSPCSFGTCEDHSCIIRITPQEVFEKCKSFLT